jgi:diguanylate cyclase (GGDEF)-like protein
VYVGAGTGLVMGLFSYMGIWVRDGDQLRETSERVDRLRKAANTDILTGIANRRVAERALNLFATGQRRYAVMVIDIDHFKAINDQHGHDTGDRILQRIAEILRARMRVQDTVARWGGEEFMVIVESVTRYESASIAESLRHMIEAGTGEILKTKISIGVAHSETGRSVDQILKRADEGYTRQKTRAVIQW